MYPRLTILFCLCLQTMSHAYEQAFPKTETGTIEVKNIPAATLIAAQSESAYFEQNGSLFRPLFRYIQANNISMTTPVEAEMQPGVMYFYIGSDASNRKLPTTDTVSVIKMPKRTVLSIGLLGSYSSKNFARGEARLRDWLSKQNQYTATGPARGIYWNGPFTLPILKRSEVHIPVAPIKQIKDRTAD